MARRPFVVCATVAVVGAAGCEDMFTTGWDDVESGHPEGATNPPSPILEVTRDGKSCSKDWVGPMVQQPGEVFPLTLGGQTYYTRYREGAVRGTTIVCPEGLPTALAAHEASLKKP